MGAHKVTLEEDAGIQRTNPRHRRSTRQRRANGVVPSPTRFSVLGVLSTWQGEWGPLRGKWGVSPFFPFVQSFFLSPFLTQKHTHNLSDLSHTHVQLFCFPLSLVSTTLLPHPLSTLGSVETPALPHQRCQKWGHNFWTEDLGHAPCLPPPCPSRRLYYLIRSSS